MNSKLARFLATGAGAGYLPVAPGTWGSLEAVVLALALREFLPGHAYSGLAMLTVCAACLGVWSATRLSRELATKDPSEVVVDEIAGQWLTLLITGLSLSGLVAGFFLFRLFDIVKPFPARQSERLAEGWGIMVDDLIAGGYAGAAYWLGAAGLQLLQTA